LTSIIFGTVRTAPANGAGGRILVVASVDSMEGKTTILTNLGVVAAERRQRVLLVDADLRRPRLHKIFGIPNERGLTDVLKQDPSQKPVGSLPVVSSASIPGLSILPSGPVNAESVALLHTAEISGLLRRCRQDFDLILIDTPPLSMYADGRILGRFSDGVVMVVRANRSSHSEITNACDRLKQDDIPVLGTILNDWRMEPHQTRAYGRYRV
jgi:capsular exopolysaccharide synthesis family protein